MIVEVTAQAAADIETAFGFLNQRSPYAAHRVRISIVKTIDSLGALPTRGRIGAISRTWEVPAHRTPYVVVYEIEGEIVRILRVRHTSQQPYR